MKCGHYTTAWVTRDFATTEKGKTMVDTTFFTQCENCEYCAKNSFGHFCEKHTIHIDNPKKDGCTWGSVLEREENQ